MKRGEVRIGVSHADYGGKPRPVLVVQGDKTSAVSSVICCPLTSFDAGARDLRLKLEPGDQSGLTRRSWVMIDKVTTYEREKVYDRIGELTVDEMQLVDAALLDALGLRR